MVYDFHSHVLPMMDDGAENIDVSRQMLEMSRADGVDVVVATPHCYPKSEEDIEYFLQKRRAATERIGKLGCPIKIVDACEVHLTGDIARFSNVGALCIGDTSYMLLEMPRSKWTDTTVDNVYKLTLMGIIPIIAHDERNAVQSAELRRSLHSLNVLVQINAQSLSDPILKKDIDRLMANGMAHILGTDMHNIATRPPCMGKAERVIKKRYGEECWTYLMNNAETVLGGRTVSESDLRAFRKRRLF